MKIRALIRMVLTLSAILACMGIVALMYTRMSATEKAEDFDLYTLVPSSSTVIVDTQDVTEFIKSLNNLNCSQDGNFLYVSRLFSLLKDHINTLLDDVPHGLSRQMNNMLISFHAPDNDRQQVLYCRLGAGDYNLVEHFIQKYCDSSFPTKYFDYRGQEIRIYPMPNDEFLSCYLTSEFFVISYQKRLIEEVIDTRLSKESVLADKSLQRIRTAGKTGGQAKVYLRMQSLSMGRSNDELCASMPFGGWTEFLLTMNGDAVYCSGMNNDNDSSPNFMNLLRKQTPLQGFPGDLLPKTTYFLATQSVSDIQEYDSLLSDFLKSHACHSATTGFFHSKDTLHTPCAIVSIPVLLADVAEKDLAVRINAYYKPFSLYELPANTLFTQFTGIMNIDEPLYATFRRETMLIGTKRSVEAYLEQTQAEEFLEGNPFYEAAIVNVSDSYNFLVLADMQQILQQPDDYARLVPNFFFRNADFFNHFLMSVQFVCVEEVLYPNLVLLYKGE